MDIRKIAWLLFIAGAGLVCLAWIGSVPTNVQWFGVGIALAGAVLSLFGKGKKEQKDSEGAIEQNKASDEEGGEEGAEKKVGSDKEEV